MNRCHFCVILVFGLAAALALGQSKAPDVFVDPEKAGPEFAIQGDYEGKLANKGKLGAQVVAEGKGKFSVLFWNGGLPGDGWDGKKPLKFAASTEDDKTTIDGQGWTGSIVNGNLSGKNADGVPFALKHVVRKSPAEGAKPPEGAKVLFDGSDITAWKNGKLVEENLLAQGATTIKEFKDFKLHVEFRLPFMPLARGQNRGNSGVYIQLRYEIQILDSFGREPKANDCAAVYQQIPPSVNMCYPPLSWQTFDIDFTSARFDDEGKKTANATVSVVHNGVKVQDAVEIKTQTGLGRKEGPALGPIYLQSHSSPVVYRNIWIVER